MSIEHWMVFGTFAEQRHFEYPAKGTYDGVVINANMAAHAPGGLAAFLLEKTAGMQYIIDPLTHAFQHGCKAILNKEGEPKSSIRRLAEIYGEPVASNVGKIPINPEHFSDEKVLRKFVRQCLDFQSNQLKEQMVKSKVAKYLDDDKREFHPYALVAPYFYLTESTLDDWLPKNLDAALIASELTDSSKSLRFASIVVSQGIVTDTEARRRIIEGYSKLDIDGFLFWVDALDEQTASKTELRGLLALASGLRKNGERFVLNLHGGYFSILAAGALGNGVLTGVAHGPEFGEYREVVPVGGGIPIAKYYIPQLHSRVRYRDALRIFRAAGWLDDADKFHAEVCNCAECQSVLDGDIANFKKFGEGTVKSIRRKHGIVRIEFPTGETKLRCLRHYLQRKKREYDVAAEEANRTILLNNLREGEDKFKSIAGLDAVAHLRLWRSIFSPEEET
ncbi:MAG: hypothetical protein K8S55_00500 [Phycisphaerae bacterium]|nr:hypothetical protein [Phycisphaerae bacterium]